MDSYWSLIDRKFPQVSRTFLIILSDFNNAVVSMVSTHPLISMSSSLLPNFWWLYILLNKETKPNQTKPSLPRRFGNCQYSSGALVLLVTILLWSSCSPCLFSKFFKVVPLMFHNLFFPIFSQSPGTYLNSIFIYFNIVIYMNDIVHLCLFQFRR